MAQLHRFTQALFCLLLCAVTTGTKGNPDMSENKIRLTFNQQEVIVTLLDNPMAQAFLQRLPLEATFEDFSGNEKITYLPQKLSTEGGINAEETKGDFCYYAPWGNLAVFYRGMGYNTSLYVLGKIDSGKDLLEKMTQNFKVRIEQLPKE